ncbi:MAG: SPOR domain-containing protein [Rickettsiales bacterium]
MKILIKKYSPLIILLIFAAFFFKLTIDAYKFYNQDTQNKQKKFIFAEHKPIKIYPKNNYENLEIGDKILYDFVSQKNWKLEANKTQDKATISPAKHEFQNRTEHKKPQVNQVINLENHTIRIVATKEAEQKLTTNKNTIQLGAYATINQAEKEKYRVINLYKEAAQKHHFYIEKVFIKNKGTIYRLKIGPFANSNLAKNFCANLRKKNLECFMTVN